MGFLSARSSVVRFAAQPAGRIDRDAICRAVNRHAFSEHDEDGLPKAEAFGWVAIHDPLVVELDATDLFFDRYLLIGFRHDRRVAPAKLVRLERRRAEEARKREQGIERLGRAVRKEIKEEVEARLLQQALPSPSLYDCAWNLETGIVFFHRQGARAARGVHRAVSRDLRRRAAAGDPLPRGGARRAAGGGRRRGARRGAKLVRGRARRGSAVARGRRVGRRRARSARVKETFLGVVEAKRFLGREFLTWLVYRLEEGGRLAIDGDVVEMALGERDGGLADDKRAALENDLFLRLADLEQVVGFLDRLFADFCTLRASARWEAEMVPALRRWIAELGADAA